MSKITIVGDLHFGVRNNSQKYLDFQTKWIEDELLKVKSDHIVFLGDTYDNRTSLSPVIINSVLELFKKIKKNFKNVH